MKKTLTMALMAVLMLGMTSCLGDKTDDITRTQLYMFNMPYDNDKPSTALPLTQSLNDIEINFTRSTFKAEITAMVTDGLQVKFSTGELKMTVGSDAYVFGAPSFPSSGANISNFEGKYNPQTGMITFDYDVNGNHHIFTTASFAYNFVTLNVYDAPGGTLEYTDDNVAFGFIPKAGEEQCTLKISGLKLNQGGSTPLVLSYPSLDYTMVAGAGFTVKATTAQDEGGHTAYDIKDVKGCVTNRGTSAQISFTMGEKYVEIAGTMFYVAK